MRFLTLVTVTAFSAISVVAMGCSGADASVDPVTGDPATSDGASDEVKAAVIDESSDGKTVSVALGKSFTIALADNGASTGYAWRVKAVDKTLGAPKETYVAGDVHKPGSSGLAKFTWSTKSPLNMVGSHVIELERSRSFGSSPPAATFKVTIEIKDLTSAPTCGGIIGKTCGADAYCNFTAAAGCGFGDQTGKCDAKPQLCPALVLPVCGCDGKTYNNSCEANRAGADVSAAGACASTK